MAGSHAFTKLARTGGPVIIVFVPVASRQDSSLPLSAALDVPALPGSVEHSPPSMRSGFIWVIRDRVETAGSPAMSPSAQLTVAGPSLLIWNKRRHLEFGALADRSSRVQTQLISGTDPSQGGLT